MKTWKEIISKLDSYRKLDDNVQDKYEELFKVIANNSYAPYIENTLASAYMEGVAGGNEELKEWLEYYAYEPGMVTSKEGKEYDFKKKGKAIDFLNDFYPLS